jgi:hypothetical protein
MRSGKMFLFVVFFLLAAAHEVWPEDVIRTAS